MSKLTLELDALKVESFGTTAGPVAGAGTVRAHAGGMVEEEAEAAITTPPATREPTCLGTCNRSCWGTCDASCPGTCAWSCAAGCSDSCATGGAICCG